MMECHEEISKPPHSGVLFIQKFFFFLINVYTKVRYGKKRLFVRL